MILKVAFYLYNGGSRNYYRIIGSCILVFLAILNRLEKFRLEGQILHYLFWNYYNKKIFNDHMLIFSFSFDILNMRLD
jgi:hypothetical protein